MSSSKAFTLIEILIVVAIMGVVMSISIPSMYRAVDRDSIRKATKDLMDLFSYARSQAIVQNQSMQLTFQPLQGVFSVSPPRTVEEAMEAMTQRELEAVLEEAEGQERVERGRVVLDEGVRIEFLGINFVPDLQNQEIVAMRFYPNGTCDECVLIIRSDRNEWRMFKLDVATALVDLTVLK